jgi:hypothetical protein
MSLLEIDWEPSPKKLRQFAWGLFAVGALAAALSWRRGHHGRAEIMLGAMWALGAATLESPRAGRAVYRAWMALAFPVASAVSFALLGLLYYGVLTPIGVALRLAGHDPLRRRRPENAGTYFTPVETPVKPSYYERLF